MARREGTQNAVVVTAILGQGVLTNGMQFYIVSSSSEEGRCHVVAVQGTRTHCDCVAASYGRDCKHARLVREHLATLGSGPPDPPAPPSAAPRESMLNRRQPFSIWK